MAGHPGEYFSKQQEMLELNKLLRKQERESGISDFKRSLPCFTYDNNMLYFAWRRSVSSGNSDDASMWFTKREASGWSEPKYAGKGMYLTSTRDGQFYTGIWGSKNGSYISEITVKNGIFSNYKKQAIPPYLEEKSHPCIAPVGRFILFDRGGDHLSVSFKKKDGTGGKSINIWDHGFEPIAGIARISPDGKYLFFKQGTGSNRDIWWVV